MISQYKFSPVQISDAAIVIAKALSTSMPGVEPLKFAGKTIADRLRKKPDSYLQYGPYWWAVKGVLRGLGEDFGAADDAGILAEYGGQLPAYSRLVAAEQFRDHYRDTFLAGTSQFWLDAEAEESYVLFDADMEVRRLGGDRPLLVSADMTSMVDGDGTAAVLDSAAGGASERPFAIHFEHEAALWTANVYALDSVAAESKVRALQDGGRIGRAIEFSKKVGDSALDSTDYARPLFVDRTARRVCEMSPTGALASA